MSGHPLIAMAQALAAQAQAAKMGDEREPVVHAGMESKIRRAVAYLDEERAFAWSPGGYITAITTETAFYLECGYRVSQSEDTWRQIDQRLAEAYWETGGFADYIGAP